MPDFVRLLLDPIPADPAWNMALDEALWQGLCDGESPPTIRIYQWRTPAISIGRFQRVEDEVDVAACAERGVTLVRRPTGGGAVCHGSDLTYTITAPEQLGDLPRGLLASYERMHAGIAEGLRAVGISAELAASAERSTDPRRALPCFVRPTRFDIVCGGRKIAGGAQRRGHGALLHQGTLALADPPSWLVRLLKKGSRSPAESRAAVLPSDTVRQAIIHGLERSLTIRYEPGAPTATESRLAEYLVRTRYGSDEWMSGMGQLTRTDAALPDSAADLHVSTRLGT